MWGASYKAAHLAACHNETYMEGDSWVLFPKACILQALVLFAHNGSAHNLLTILLAEGGEATSVNDTENFNLRKPWHLVTPRIPGDYCQQGKEME